MLPVKEGVESEDTLGHVREAVSRLSGVKYSFRSLVKRRGNPDHCGREELLESQVG